MLKLLKSEEGFTLMEAIISIATLAVISGFILQMFIVSDEVNKKARDVDICSATAMNAIEMFKSQTNPEDYMEDDFFKDCYVNADEKEINIYKGYDDKWEQIKLNDGSFDLENLPSDIVFILNIDIKTEGMQGPDSYVTADTRGEASRTLGTGRMYTMNTVINKYKKIEEAEETNLWKEIVNFKAVKYFAN